jgi:hypothetical protein
MSSGLACDDWRGETTLGQMRESPDWVQFALDLPTTSAPGATFSYCNAGMHLLSAILQQATGVNALEFARANLFDPLGIEDAYWPSDPQGVTNGWGDLALKPPDAAKLGFLYLNGGEWEGRRILSREWVAEATRGQVPTGGADDYGFGWWVSSSSREPTYFRADGTYGQRILVVPSLDLVVVTTGGGFSPDRIFESIASAAADDSSALPANPAGTERLRSVVERLAQGPEPEPVPPSPPMASRISGRTYVFDPNRYVIHSLRLDFDDPAEATLTFDLTSEPISRVDRVGLDGVFRPSREGRPIMARGFWQDPRTFVIECDEGPGLHAYDLELRFREGGVVLEVLGEVVEGSAAGPPLVSPSVVR